MVDVSVRLDDDILTIKLFLAGVLLANWSIDLVKEPEGVKHGTKTKG